MTELSKPTRAPKAIAVSKLIGGKLVTELAASKQAELVKAMALCGSLGIIPEWREAATEAMEALVTLIAVVKNSA